MGRPPLPSIYRLEWYVAQVPRRDLISMGGSCPALAWAAFTRRRKTVPKFSPSLYSGMGQSLPWGSSWASQRARMMGRILELNGWITNTTPEIPHAAYK